MELLSKWPVILAGASRRKLLPLDVQTCSPIALRNIVLDVHTPDSILEQIAHTYYDDEEILRDLVLCRNLSETTLAFIALTASDEIKAFISGTRVVDVVTGEAKEDAETPGGKKKLNITQVILKMKPSQKIKLALTGSKDARGILIRESSKTISLGVLANPRLTIGEVEAFAKSQNMSEDVIRKIGTNAEWTRKNSIAASLVFNPKTPVGISLGFMSRMTERDLGILEKSKSVPEAVRTQCAPDITEEKNRQGVIPAFAFRAAAFRAVPPARSFHETFIHAGPAALPYRNRLHPDQDRPEDRADHGHQCVHYGGGIGPRGRQRGHRSGHGGDQAVRPDDVAL